jgi:16S rRNA (adenine1518-N6/adenine1519-N6)-dimethyltransferase
LNFKPPINPKKSLGQHFLKDENIARKIVDSLSFSGKYNTVLEIGPGMGVLTKYLLEKKIDLVIIEKDKEAVDYLNSAFSTQKPAFKIISADFLRFDLSSLWTLDYGLLNKVAVIGNFPYNISTQILFRILEYRNNIPEVVGMFQKEVAQRIAASPDNKTYGILSVLIKAFYNIEYLFTVNENVFIPPPKVKSAVIRLTRNDKPSLDCNEELFFEIVKTAFNQRRKMLRNALKSYGDIINNIDNNILSKRAENLTVEDFVNITQIIIHH